MTKQEEIDSLLNSIVTWSLAEQPQDVIEYVESEKAKMNEHVKKIEEKKNETIITHLNNILAVLKHHA